MHLLDQLAMTYRFIQQQVQVALTDKDLLLQLTFQVRLISLALKRDIQEAIITQEFRCEEETVLERFQHMADGCHQTAHTHRRINDN